MHFKLTESKDHENCLETEMGFLDALKRLDAYPRTLEDFSVRTISGAAGNQKQFICAN